MDDKYTSDESGRYVANSPYKIVVPKKVEEIIRYYCSMSPNNEWSGILFYKVEGDFDSPEFKVVCEDIYLMDIGSAGFTSYDFKSADISTYLMDHPELLDCYQGLIHSHDTMPAFFSGTDTKTLQSEGNDTIIFVSLIVNNAGKYVASITRKVTYKSVITEQGEYPFFGDTVKTTQIETLEDSHEELQYFPLEVIREEVEQHPMAQRFLEVQQSKQSSSRGYSVGEFADFGNSQSRQEVFEDWGRSGVSKANSVIMEQSLPFLKEDEEYTFRGGLKTTEDLVEDAVNGQIPYGQVHINKKVLNAGIIQIVTGSCFVNTDKIDLKNWCAKLDDVYHKRFKTEDFEEDTRAGNFIDSWVEFVVWDTEDSKLQKQGFDEDTIAALFAYDASQELTEIQASLKESSDILQAIINKLNDYMI